MIKKLQLKNFLSYKDVSIYFQDYNVILGANASGKSNLIKAILALKDQVINGVFQSEESYSDFFENYFRKSSDPKENIQISCEIINPFIFNIENSNEKLITNHHQYSIEYSQNQGVVKEVYNVKFNEELKSDQILSRIESKAKVMMAFNPKDKKGIISQNSEIPPELNYSALINKTNSNLPIGLIASISNTFIYKLDARDIVRASTWKNQKIVNVNGSNLAGVLEFYKQNNSQVVSSINEILKRNIPGHKEVVTERLGTKSGVYFAVNEKDGSQYAFNELSDGTDYFIALITALVVLQFTEIKEGIKGIILIEEPEKCLHPQLLSEIVEITKLLSSKYQIIITTHSTELVSQLKPEDLILVDKNEDGTRVKRGETTKEVEAFLKEFSLDQVWLYNELEGGIAVG